MPSFSTGHTEMIHDAQLDYYGQKLATASSDRTIKVFEIAGDQQNLLAELKGHDGPVWQVSWAHPKFGNMLASSSYDGNVCIWKEAQPNVWQRIYVAAHGASVSSISWGPHAFGAVLAAACADGSVSIISAGANNQWHQERFMAHEGGCNAVSWGPDFKAGALLASSTGQNIGASQRIVTGGCDKFIRIWSRVDGKWCDEKKNFEVQQAWVRDVQWAPSMGLPSSTIATCSDDKSVSIWTEDSKGQWTRKPLTNAPFEHKVWKLSWSLMGNILAVSQGNNVVSLWKEALDGKWQNLSALREGQQKSN
jgi:protein transport protein SEC13